MRWVGWFLGVAWSVSTWTGCQATPSVERVDQASLIDVSPGLRVDRASQTVSVKAWVCLDRGWLEQVLCSPGTREHEALMVTNVPPSMIHAALLIIELMPGQPGKWVEADGVIELEPPQGSAVDVRVEYVDPSTKRHVNVQVSDWIADVESRKVFPHAPFIFGGSLLIDPEEAEAYDSNYVADHTGSIIGLVTFGDEMLGPDLVIPDEESVHAPEWVVLNRNVPPVGTPVHVLLSPAR